MENLNDKLRDSPTLENIYENLKLQLNSLHRHARQGSYNTRTRYYYAMLVFIKFVAVVFRLERLVNLSSKHICAYIEWRQSCEIAPATIKSELCAIRYYHDQMSSVRHPIPSNDALSVNLERRRFGETDRTWSEAEYEAFCTIARDEGKENFADLFVLAHDLGLRIHEAFRIDAAMVRAALNTGALHVKGKGGKERTVPMTPDTNSIFERLLESTAPGNKLFVKDGEPTHLAILAFQQWIICTREYIRDRNNSVALTYHGLRHTYAANTYARLKREGRTDFEAHIAVSRLLGHERADVTDIYLVANKDGWDTIST